VPSYFNRTFETEGDIIKFDQRSFTTPEEFQRASLAQWGHLFIPKRCADGTVARCHLSLFFFGCGDGLRLGHT
jgi:hypothetical protein